MAVSKSRDYEFLVNEGRKQERKYDWVAAVVPYGRALTATLKLNDFSKGAKIYERIGFCYHRAAMQAKNLREFKNRTLQAINAYSKSAELFKKVEKLAKICHCKAIVAYVGSWVKPDFDSRKRLLDECWKLEKDALKFYKRIDDRLNLGKTCNELSMCLIDRLNLEWDKQKRKKMLNEALSYGEKAIPILSELREEYELARAYYTTSIHYYTGASGLELEKKRKYQQKTLSYSKKAVKFSEKIGDRFLLGVSNISLGSAITSFTDRPDSAARHFENALQCGIDTRDNYLIGRASYCLASLVSWKMVAEEDPEKKKEESKKCEKYSEDAIHHFRSISCDQEIASSYYWYAENYNLLAKSAETSPEKKRIVLKKSIAAGRKGLEHARRSGSISATWLILHPLSKSLFFLSNMETDLDVKKRLLEESLLYREENIKTLEQAMPYYFWNHGVRAHYLALIQAELAEIEIDEERKVKLLEDAIESAEKCISLCLRDEILGRGQHATLGRYYSDFGRILNRLYLITETPELLGKLLEVFRGAVEIHEKADLPSRVAEGYWQLAKTHNKLQNYAESAESFELAHENFVLAAGKIPSLKDFYVNHASYMKGWSEIEKARHFHARQEYSQAKKHYEKAARSHESSKSWKYLATNYLAWAQLEHGEDLSRGEQTEEARDIFHQVAELFAEAKKSIKAELERIEIREEKEMAAELVKASDVRCKYCLGRIALEEAKILDRQGEHAASSRKYGSATGIFQKAIDATEHESDRQELKPIIYLCQAWQMMTRAEAEASPNLYLEASQIFDEAKEHSFDEKTKLLALGHSCFCKALEAGRKFEATGDATLHLAATQHLEGAANYYVRAGFKTASEYAKATQRLLDAHLYMHKAKTEINPIKKAQYYRMAKKLLQASADSYVRAKNPEKSEDVQRLLESVEEEQQLAVSLTEVLHVPTIASTTASFSIPTPTHERAVGLERFEHANIQTNMIIHEKEIRVGEDFNLEMQVVNVGKEVVILDKVEEILPAGFEPVAKPDYFHFEDTHLDMKGKRLDPLKTEEIRLVLRSFNIGTFEIKPRIIYLDETGYRMTSEPDPVAIKVSAVVLPGRITTGYGDLNNLLFGGIPKNYSVLLTSPSCDERDLLIKRFLEAGAKEGQVTLFVTIGASEVKTLAEEFQSNFYLLICNPQADKIIKSLPNVFKSKGVENLTDISIALSKAFRRLDTSISSPRRACIEIISDVLLQHHAVQTRRWLTDIITGLKSKGFTTLGVMNPQMHSPQEVQTILDLFEGEINIYEKETRKGLERFLKIKKMHYQKYSKSELLLQEEKPQE